MFFLQAWVECILSDRGVQNTNLGQLSDNFESSDRVPDFLENWVNIFAQKRLYAVKTTGVVINVV